VGAGVVICAVRSMIVTSTPVGSTIADTPTNEVGQHEPGAVAAAYPQAVQPCEANTPQCGHGSDRAPAPVAPGAVPRRGRLVVDPTRPRGHRGQPRLCGHCRCSVRRATAPRDNVDACPRSRGSDHQIKSGRHTLTMSRPVGRRHRSQPAVASSTPETTPTPRDLSINHTVTGASRPRRSTPSTSTSRRTCTCRLTIEKQLHRVPRPGRPRCDRADGRRPRTSRRSGPAPPMSATLPARRRV
jgi:hypothetical protein